MAMSITGSPLSIATSVTAKSLTKNWHSAKKEIWTALHITPKWRLTLPYGSEAKLGLEF